MSKAKIIYALIIGLSSTLSACSLFESSEEGTSSEASMSSGNAEYDNMLASVTANHKSLAKAGGAWTTADEGLEKAAEAAKNKEFDKAVKLLKEVDEATTMAKAQFDDQKNAGPHLF